MPTDSTVRPRTPRSFAAIGAALALLGTAGCTTAPTVVHDELLEPLTLRQPFLPSPADLAAARLARAALISQPIAGVPDPAVDDALAAVVEAVAQADAQGDDDGEDLVHLATDLRNAALDDPIAYRAASRELDKEWGVDPRLSGRLERTIRDDPLRLAGRRQFDGWHRLWARTFNAVAEPIGSSAITGFVLAPYQLTNSLLHYFAEFSNSEPLSLTDRQALALREEFVARHPDSIVAPEVREKIERDRPKLALTLAKRRLRASENARAADNPTLALHHARAAKRLLDAYPERNASAQKKAATAVRDATEMGEAKIARRLSVVEAIPTHGVRAETERTLALALFVAEADPGSLDEPIAAYRAATEADPDHEAAGRIDFVRALAQHERGFEASARERLQKLATVNPEHDTMVRHARALLDDDWQNPYGAFDRLRRKATRDELAWRLAGQWVTRPRYPNLPTPVAYLIDAPAIAMTLILAPLRAVISPFTGGTPDFRRAPALAGYRYLVRYPEGEEQRPIIRWLYGYELDQERWGRALRMADWIPDFDPEERSTLVEKTATNRVDRVGSMDRRDTRASILRGVAREFPDSEGGQLAGLQARAEQEDASPQFIRITRGFLIENPEVAGPRGLGLNPALLNEDLRDGELHEEGIVLRGGRLLEIRLVAEGLNGSLRDGDEAEPESRTLKLSKVRLKRLAASLDEAVQRNSLVDVDARQKADPNRDLFLERASLGLTEEFDTRPTAQSTFVYQSLRERYGAVRGRDSVLPFDLVFRGSLGDFSLGAFPRWRPPRETPDAFLYR